MPDVDSLLDRLAASALPDGGWAYHGTSTREQIEPTCFACLALAANRERYGEVLTQGLAALDRHRRENGAVVHQAGREQAVWPTALVLFTHATLGSPADTLRPLASRLLSFAGRIPTDIKSAEFQDIDIHLRGWPWAEGNFSWTEPTAWACIALRKAGFGEHPRVSEGLRLLLDRARDDGGINYGNRRILDNFTDPIPTPTALMLLALQGHGHQPRVAAALRYLAQHAANVDACADDEHLAWICLALHAHRDSPEAQTLAPIIDERLRAARAERDTIGWLAPSPYRLALTALALARERHDIFRLETAQPTMAIEAAPLLDRSPPFVQRIVGFVRGKLIEGLTALRPVAPTSVVHVAPVSDYNADLADVLRRQFETFRAELPIAGKRVVLKPNLVEYHRDKVINTHPHVVAAAIEWCRREGAAEVIVAEGPGHWRNVEYLVRASGLGDVLRHYGTPFVDLNHDEPVKLTNLGRTTGMDHLFMAQTIVNADVLISMPKLKTHHWAGATLSLKNLFGTLPGICYGWPKNELHWRGIDNSIVDIALTRTPDLAIVDAIVGMEGDGPLNGTPKPLGALVMGRDLLAVDATCARLMMLDPEKIGHLRLGQLRKLGQLDAARIEQRGERIESLARPFEQVAHFRGLCLGQTPA